MERQQQRGQRAALRAAATGALSAACPSGHEQLTTRLAATITTSVPSMTLSSTSVRRQTVRAPRAQTKLIANYSSPDSEFWNEPLTATKANCQDRDASSRRHHEHVDAQAISRYHAERNSSKHVKHSNKDHEENGTTASVKGKALISVFSMKESPRSTETKAISTSRAQETLGWTHNGAVKENLTGRPRRTALDHKGSRETAQEMVTLFQSLIEGSQKQFRDGKKATLALWTPEPGKTWQRRIPGSQFPKKVQVLPCTVGCEEFCAAAAS